MTVAHGQDAREKLVLLWSLLGPDGALRQIVRARKLELEQGTLRKNLLYIECEVFALYESLDRLLRQRQLALPLIVIANVLDKLNDLLRESDVVDDEPYDGLRALRDRFTHVQSENEMENWSTLFRFTDTSSANTILEALTSCNSEIDQHVDLRGESILPTMRSSKRKGPNYDIWTLNNKLLKAFLATAEKCDGCSKLSTRLALVTYRKSVKLEMETFVCLNEDISWGQEVKLDVSVEEPSGKAIKMPKIKWADQDSNTLEKNTTPKRKRRQVLHLCTPLKSARESRIKLHFLTEGEAMYLENKSQPLYTPEALVDAISLKSLSYRANAVITEETKLIIAVILGHTLIHSYSTPWIKDWKLENIVFIRCGSIVPLRPFLVSRHASKESDEDEDEAYFSRLHANPDILGLGVMLLELSLKQSIHTYTNNESVNVKYNADYLAAQAAYTKHQRDLHLRYRNAIERCLDCDFANELEDLDDVEEARHRIYQEIVKPLEDELEAGFRDWVDVENLDTEVREMDVAGYGERYHIDDDVNANSPDNASADGQTGISTGVDLHQDTIHIEAKVVDTISGRKLPVLQLHNTDSVSDVDTTAGHANLQTTSGRLTARRSKSPLPRQRSVSPMEMREHVSGFSLFDDFQPEGQISVAAAHTTDSWFDKFQRLTDTIEEAKGPRIKIAILDTGIDLQHNDIVACAENIKDVRNWVDGNDGIQDWTSGDDHGHGTHVAGILIDGATEADIYIAKITQDGKSIGMDSVAKAIHFAAHQWKVDIISISFGFPKRVPAIDIAIDQAPCLVFAAAANHGGNYERAHPAKHERVICVHSTDGTGNKSPFNPSPFLHCENFSIVGEAVESAWLCGARKRKSGTSFATPVAAGLAAFILEWVKQQMPHDHEILRQLKTSGGMRAVFRLMAAPRDGYSYLAPWSLFDYGAASASASIRKALG